MADLVSDFDGAPSGAGTVSLRTTVVAQDVENVERIVRSTGAFREDEIPVAIELVSERLSRGETSGYHFVFAERDGRTVGYACYGPIACSLHGWDLYWIAVEGGLRGAGIGRRLIEACERDVADRGGRRIYVETSSKPDYAATRAFYEALGYAAEATLFEFYAPGDSKVIFVKS